jgi:hypothetical protein
MGGCALWYTSIPSRFCIFNSPDFGDITLLIATTWHLFRNLDWNPIIALCPEELGGKRIGKTSGRLDWRREFVRRTIS